jgi:predicted RNA-binding protein YlxR (DUF448 family)
MPHRPPRENPITPETPNPTESLPDAAEDLPDEPETGPLRRCAMTRERLPKERMIRFVVAPDRSIVPDVAASLPGRGIWLSARADVIENARARGAFAKAARGQVTVPADLLSVLQFAVSRRVGDTLGLARRAGQAACGFSKAREWLAAGRVGLVVQARDGSVDERARFLGGAAGRVPTVAPMDAAQLGVVFGRDHVVHVAIAPGPLAMRLLHESQRLAGLMGLPDDPQGSGTGVAAPADATTAYRAVRPGRKATRAARFGAVPEATSDNPSGDAGRQDDHPATPGRDAPGDAGQMQPAKTGRDTPPAEAGRNMPPAKAGRNMKVQASR